jgi:hypothetical protein
MPQPTVKQVHVNRPLTNISVAYAQNAMDFIANRVFPSIPVMKQGDQYYIYDRGVWNRIAAQKRAPATESAGSGYVLSTGSYFAKKSALHSDIADEERANADSVLNTDRDHTEYVTDNLLMLRESEWGEAFFTTGVWGTDLVGVAAAPAAGQFLQFDNANSTPIEVIEEQHTAMKQATGKRPNTLVLGAETKSALKNHPDVVDRIKYAQRETSVIGLSEMATLFEVDQVLVADSITNVANEGATEDSEFILNSKSMLLCYSEPSPGIKKASAGYIYEWTGLLPGSAGGATISKFRMEELKADRVEGEMAYDMKVVAADLGIFFSACVG